MSLFSNWIHGRGFWRGGLPLIVFILIFIASSKTVFAINLNVIYFASCDREIGIILDVTPQNIKMLTLKGKVREVLRHEIIFFADYPLTTIPIEEMDLEDVSLQTVVIQTLVDNQFVNLVEGWPINFTDEKISFLTTKGGEAIIDRDNIWKIRSYTPSQTITFPTKIKNRYNFVHPYSFQHCPIQYEGNLEVEEIQTIYPQQTLNDQVRIKRELDRLEEGHQRILDYQEFQIYYSVAQLNHNDTSLGYWFNVGSRYGSSSNRSNNTSPILISEYSNGPFELQQILITGSAPLTYGIHEESQNQVYYRLKGEFIRFAIFFNPSVLILTGEKYQWQKDELDRLDNRAFDHALVEVGFDYHSFTGIFGFNGFYYGARIKDRFISGLLLGEFYRFNFRNHLIQGQLSWGNGYDNASDTVIGDDGLPERLPHDSTLSFARLNLEWYGFKKWHPLYSLIYRDFDTTQENAIYSSQSLTNTGYLTYQYSKKYSFAGYLSLETLNQEAKDDNQSFEETDNYLKTGVNVTLSF